MRHRHDHYVVWTHNRTGELWVGGPYSKPMAVAAVKRKAPVWLGKIVKRPWPNPEQEDYTAKPTLVHGLPPFGASND